MTILVTGASGFLGGHLVQALVNRGESVRVLVRKTSRIAHLQGLPISVCYGDLTDQESLNKAVQNVDLIFHCAALSSDWGTYAQFYDANVTGVQHLLEAASRNNKLERFVHISTTDVYGFPSQACDETYPLTIIGLPYNTTKVLGEQVVWQAHHEGRVPVTVIRPASIYGPRGTEFVEKIGEYLQAGFMAVFDGGRTHAGLLYVDNAVDCMIVAARSAIALGQAYNLRDDIEVSWREYVDAFANRLGTRKLWINLPSSFSLKAARLLELLYQRLQIKGDPPLTRHAILLLSRTQGYAIDKVRRDLGFQSMIGFEEGLDRSVKWFQTRG